MALQILDDTREKEFELIHDISQMACITIMHLQKHSRPGPGKTQEYLNEEYTVLGECILDLSKRACVHVNGAHQSIKSDN